MSIIALAISVIFIIFGVPLALRIVGPNRWYGVRTSTTLSDPQVWYDINSTGGKALMLAGALSLISILLLSRFWTGSADLETTIGITIPLAFLAVVLTFLALD